MCDACPKRFSSIWALKSHEKSHRIIHKCTECNNKEFASFKSYNNHKAVVHGIGEKIEKKDACKFMCEKCGRLFYSEKILEEHDNIHTGVKPFICEHCGKAFYRNQSLKIHLFVHTEETLFTCEYCGKQFKRKSSLQLHMRIHSKVTEKRNPYECQICNKRLSCKSGHMLHMRLHAGEKPNKCSYEGCSAEYADKGQLSRHITKDHLNIKEFVCPIEDCGRDFYFAPSLRRHMVSHSETRDFKCLECNKTFKMQKNLDLHVKFVHRNERNYKCNVCGKR